MLDCTYRVRIPHHAGQLALVARAIADGDGLIGDVVTVSLGREHSVRDITVEVRDIAQSDRIAELVGALDGVNVLWHQDRALLRHIGGKLTINTVDRAHGSGDARRLHPRGRARVHRDRRAARARRPLHDDRAERRDLHQRLAVLGLGNIGPVASMPVMEGKAVFYDQFVGISAMPILIDATDVDAYVNAYCGSRPRLAGSTSRTSRRRVLRDRAATEGGAAPAGHAR